MDKPVAPPATRSLASLIGVPVLGGSSPGKKPVAFSHDYTASEAADKSGSQQLFLDFETTEAVPVRDALSHLPGASGGLQ